MEKTVKLAMVKDLIAWLQKMPADAAVYFDCPACGKANGFCHIGNAVMITTRGAEEPERPKMEPR